MIRAAGRPPEVFRRALTSSFLRASAAYEREDVAIWVLEPGIPDLPGDVNVTLSSNARHVIVLEDDAFRLERADNVFQLVADSPRDGRRLVRAGIRRLIDQNRRVATLVADHSHLFGPDRLQSERAFIKFAGVLHILDRDGG